VHGLQQVQQCYFGSLAWWPAHRNGTAKYGLLCSGRFLVLNCKICTCSPSWVGVLATQRSLRPVLHCLQEICYLILVLRALFLAACSSLRSTALVFLCAISLAVGSCMHFSSCSLILPPAHSEQTQQIFRK